MPVSLVLERRRVVAVYFLFRNSGCVISYGVKKNVADDRAMWGGRVLSDRHRPLLCNENNVACQGQWRRLFGRNASRWSFGSEPRCYDHTIV